MTDGPHRLAVIGAGPAGLAACLAAAARGVQVTLIDAAPEAGGQFYRRPASGLGARRPSALHHRWSTWSRLEQGLAAHLEAGTVEHLPDHHVWTVERTGQAPGAGPGFTVHALIGPLQERSVAVRADAVLLATGGYEKVLPFPGWTLPGVVTAGGAQAMLKGGLVVPGRRAVVAGSGPLLLPVATGLSAAGVEVAALVESLDPRRLSRAAVALASAPGKAVEGALYAFQLLRHRIPFLPRHTVVEAQGEGHLEAVTVAALGPDGRVRPGTARSIPCEAFAVGHGMIPHTDLAEALGCRVDGVNVSVDDEQRTDVPGVWAAGETTGIGGAELALAEGHIAGRSAAARLHGTAPDPSPAARVRTRTRRFAAALDTVYRPPLHWADQVTDDTVVCRCEEVTAGRVREAVTDLGAGDLRTVKLLTRAGMGWCQGRICEPAVAGLTGCEQTPARRMPARPVPLGELARAGADDDESHDDGNDHAPGRDTQPPKPTHP
ncbi:NAD(P)/FAD-dependent oxidoreductase [Streptomyces aureus]|uniref:NAD(P)/FAD-dependent oxidoreductase n=1 Tax=Streptomyces aureus TaxID=193461 RepID=UPI00068AAD15|nr:NAD(P)/FAD-dependent oxidoreductase [Streptomyces aureus]